MESEQNDKKQIFHMTKTQVLELAKSLSYEEKLRLVFALIPQGDFYNSRYRDTNRKVIKQ